MVINLPAVDQVEAVNRLARTTGSTPVPTPKVDRGYRYEKRKFEIASLTPAPSETVAPPRVAECPVQLEAILQAEHTLDAGGPLEGAIVVFEMRITRVLADENILLDQNPNRIDPDKWRPLIMSFQEFYGLGPKVHPSALGEISESLYRTPDTGGMVTPG